MIQSVIKALLIMDDKCEADNHSTNSLWRKLGFSYKLPLYLCHGSAPCTPPQLRRSVER